MTNLNIKLREVVTLCALVATLSACGESDLEDLHAQALDDGVAAAASASAGSEGDAGPETGGSPEAATPVTLDLSQYDLMFADEYNGSTLDERKWVTSPIDPDTVIYNQLQYYVDAQDAAETFDSPFLLDDGLLTIRATQTPAEQLADANGQAYLSGLLSSRNLFKFTYGYVEARINVTAGRGIWPALWMLSSESDGLRPEIYIVEYDGSKPDSAFHTYNYVDSAGNLRSPGQQQVQLGGFSDGFHTVGVRWTEDELLYFVDGQPTWRIIGDNVPKEDMYLMLSLAMGGLWTGAPDGTTPDPADLVVDYVRVYQLRNP